MASSSRSFIHLDFLRMKEPRVGRRARALRIIIIRVSMGNSSRRYGITADFHQRQKLSCTRVLVTYYSSWKELIIFNTAKLNEQSIWPRPFENDTPITHNKKTIFRNRCVAHVRRPVSNCIIRWLASLHMEHPDGRTTRICENRIDGWLKIPQQVRSCESLDIVNLIYMTIYRRIDVRQSAKGTGDHNAQVAAFRNTGGANTNIVGSNSQCY
ncbi:hypothetical protein P154DRAFT_294481 [Amniculicola lignicola CBS 123094]|uniref:Uncharacterized protein n=1 Tax=Amniculicola lignicola CBS 123094 TaxID=1392246 RepID=A0A6A5W954_9PLEO|nr:hypothetical protein P154DRAFT_294481 [Amniculicola lignicola CBS 123094]